MTAKRDLIIAALCIFCLAFLLFSIPTVIGPSIPPYNPWLDINEDGLVNMRDIRLIIDGCFGDADNDTEIINRTRLLEQQSQIDDLENLLNELQSRVDSLNASLLTLNNTLVLVWDSGWYGPTIGGDTVFNFNSVILNVEDAVVYMVGKKTLSGDPHQIDYGGFVNTVYYYGAYWWKLTPTSITFHRHGNDENWVYVRITIWQRITLP